jgi:flagellar protein FliS
MNPYKVVYNGYWNFSDTKDCPFCGEKIKRIAIKCKHCLSILDTKEKSESIAQAEKDHEASDNNLQIMKMLFDEFLERVSSAREYIQQKNLNKKSEAISGASRIVTGLQGALNIEKGGELANNLNELYNYVTRRLFEANAHNDLAALKEIHDLMQEIRDACTRMPSSN